MIEKVLDFTRGWDLIKREIVIQGKEGFRMARTDGYLDGFLDGSSLGLREAVTNAYFIDGWLEGIREGGGCARGGAVSPT